MEIPRGTVRSERVESRVLRGNLPGDPDVRDLYVYLPPGYEEGKERYPVAWCLSGFTGRGRMLLNDNPWAPALDDRMDSLVSAGCGEHAKRSSPSGSAISSSLSAAVTR